MSISVRFFVTVFPFIIPLLTFAATTALAEKSLPETSRIKSAASSMNSFAVDLYGKFSAADGNLVFSPYSISMGLGMAYGGAHGDTERQMAKALHIKLPQAEVGAAFSELTSEVLSARKKNTVELNIANGLWVEKSFPFRKEYLESMRVYSDRRGWLSRLLPYPFSQSSSQESEIRQLDFKNDPDGARNIINKWVEVQTNNKIQNLLGGGIDKYTRLVLSNAVYFKAKWLEQFKKEFTENDDFFLLNGTKTKVKMMTLQRDFGYAEEPGLQILEMLYKGEDLSMVVLLPSRETSFKEFEQSMTPDKLEQWIGRLRSQKVNVFFPKFDMISRFQLRQRLTELGVKDAFSDKKADFSGMTGGKDFYISEAAHQAFIKVNEEGTEAGAAIIMIFKYTGMPPQPKIFRADHPFVFFIRHRPTNCILFFGRVTDPPR